MDFLKNILGIGDNIKNFLKTKKKDIEDTFQQFSQQAAPVIQRVQSLPKQFQAIPQAIQMAPPIRDYIQQVNVNKQTPFFNNTDNTPFKWIGKVADDVKKRGIFEGLQDLTYPILTNPYIEPLTEPITGAVRVANYKAGRPSPLIN